MNFEALTGRWDYSSLPSNIQLGRDCFLEREDTFSRFRSSRSPGLVIGERVQIYTWTVFNVEPSGYVEIGDDSILVGAVLMCAETITIGKRVTISYNVTIADSDFHPVDPEQRKKDAEAISPEGDYNKRPSIRSFPVVIDDDVWIGIGAIILKGVHLGAGCRVGPGAVVTSDISPGTTVYGNPAMRIENLAEE